MEQNDALYWSPRGGNNYKDFWGSCHAFTSKQTNKDTGVVETDTILVDLGQHEQTRDYENGRFDKVVPALDDIIEIPGFPEPDPEKKCKALFVSHGHSDHIGAISTYVSMGAKLPPIYCSKMSANLIMKDFIEKGIDEAKWPEIKEINAGDTITVGNLKVRTMAASHSIPGAFSFKISNDSASIFHTGDTKGDPSSFLGNGVNFDDYKKIAEQGPIDLMTFDGTTAANNGHATYESEVKGAYSTLIKRHSDKQLIMPMPAAHAERIATIISAAAENGKDVIINGGPVMDSTIVGLQMSGYDLQKLNPNIRIVGANSEEAKKLDPKKTITITTGIYGESNAPMTQFCNGDKSAINIEKDAVIITPLIGSRSERLAQLLAKCPDTKDLITYTSKDLSTLYGSGHAQRDDFIKIAGILKPKAVTTCHASTKLANRFINMASELGYATLGRQIRNAETVKVTAQGCEVIPNEKKNWFGWEKNGEDKKPEKFHDDYGTVESCRKEIEKAKKAYFERQTLNKLMKNAMVNFSKNMGGR
ncbi:MAG: MBL fold metallo-hydrolase [Alphaproteobacteria bacterium]|nr:MBL fold metallo-hydrolase [Alphaproteobacteria bacterium]